MKSRRRSVDLEVLLRAATDGFLLVGHGTPLAGLQLARSCDILTFVRVSQSGRKCHR
jgi:hypothetical protein